MKKFMIAVTMMVVSVSAAAGDFGMVLGAIVGAAAGAQVGNGNGKTLATVAGAMIGGKIGSRVEDSGNSGEYTCVENCGGGAQYGTYDREAEAAAARGAANRLQREHDRERAYATRQAYCSQDPEGCRYGRGYAYNSGHPIIWR